MAVEDDDYFCCGRGTWVFLFEDADNIVVVQTRNRQRRRRHPQSSSHVFRSLSLPARGDTRAESCWGNGTRGARDGGNFAAEVAPNIYYR
jgi:hypothetical protein